MRAAPTGGGGPRRRHGPGAGPGRPVPGCRRRCGPAAAQPRGASCAGPSTEPGRGVGAAGPVGRVHPPLADGLDLAQAQHPGAGAHQHLLPAHGQLAGGQRALDVGVRDRLQRADLEPLALPGRPRTGCGGAGAERGGRRARAGWVQSSSASATSIFGARVTPSAGCWARASSGAVLDAVEGGHEQAAPRPRRAARAGRPRCRAGRTRSVITPNVGPASRAAHDPEGGRAGDLVPGPQGVLHRRGAAPGAAGRRSAG